MPLSSCDRGIDEYIRSVGISDISSEVELILARASTFSFRRNIPRWTVCPAHRFSFGIGWRRGANRCRVPVGLANDTNKRKAGRVIGKTKSKEILRYTEVFVAVGSGMQSIMLLQS